MRKSCPHCPNSFYSCFFDGVKGKEAELMTTTIPLAVLMCTNTLLYFMTWYKLRKDEPRFIPTTTAHGRKSSVSRGSRRAVKNMTLFIVAFVMQWLPLVVYGICVQTSDVVPSPIFHCVTFFSNIGGILNGVIFFLIRRGRNANEGRSSNVAIVAFNNDPTRKL